MNKPLSRSQIAALTVDTANMLERATRPEKRHGAPFSKTGKGKARRAARRDVASAKRAWLNS